MGTEGEARAGGGGARSGWRDPQQVQRQSPERCALADEPLGDPRPGGQISERGGAAPRVSVRRLAERQPRESLPARPTPLPFSFLLPSAAPRDACAAPRPLRRGRLPSAVCPEEPETPERGQRERAGSAPGAPSAAECSHAAADAVPVGSPARPPRPGLLPARPGPAAASVPLSRGPETQATYLPGASGRLRRQTTTLCPTLRRGRLGGGGDSRATRGARSAVFDPNPERALEWRGSSSRQGPTLRKRTPPAA